MNLIAEISWNIYPKFVTCTVCVMGVEVSQELGGDDFISHQAEVDMSDQYVIFK